MTTTQPEYKPPFEQAIRKKARQMYQEEGTLEIDHDAIVSQSGGRLLRRRLGLGA